MSGGDEATAVTRVQTDPLIGQRFGHFHVVRRLGTGGMGTVYLGEHAVIGSRVAIKVLHPHLAADPAFVERFLNEARCVNRIAHENTVSIFDLGGGAGVPPYLVMEHLEGEPLSAMLGAPLPLEAARPILLQLCAGLEAAHAVGVVHRDLKPDNVFLVRRGGGEPLVKILDFGIAKLSGSAAGLTRAGVLVGTPDYMSPEQWAGDAVDLRADVYALGIIAFELLVGRRPYRGATLAEMFWAHAQGPLVRLRDHLPSAPERLERLLLDAMARDREERVASCADFARRLRELDAAPTPTPTPAPRPAATPARTFSARALWPGQRQPVAATVSQLSRAGLFLHLPAPLPALLARVRVTLVLVGGELPFEAEVVRHVSEEQARVWGQAPGAALQVLQPTLEIAGALDRLSRGLEPEWGAAAAPVAAADHPGAAALLASYRDRRPGDHYAVLDLAPDAPSGEVRPRARAASAQLERFAGKLSARQREEADALLERIHAAATVLGTPAWRAAHDAERANFRGVARCLAAGLDPAELEGLRAHFLATRPENAEGAARQRDAAELHLLGGATERALRAFEQALRLDPLDLALHRRYWKLRRTQAG